MAKVGNTREEKAGLKTASNKRIQLRSLRSLRPSANGSANALACSKGYSAIQVPHSLHLTCRIPPFRDGDSIVQTTSVCVAALQAITRLKKSKHDNII
jgi:hypothetical protein